MRADKVKLTMPDGSERIILDTIMKDIRLCDRATDRLWSEIKNLPIRRSRLDREVAWLHECVNVEEPDGSTDFAETKDFLAKIQAIRDVLDKIELHSSRGSLQIGSRTPQ